MWFVCVTWEAPLNNLWAIKRKFRIVVCRMSRKDWNDTEQAWQSLSARKQKNWLSVQGKSGFQQNQQWKEAVNLIFQDKQHLPLGKGMNGSIFFASHPSPFLIPEKGITATTLWEPYSQDSAATICQAQKKNRMQKIGLVKNILTCSYSLMWNRWHFEKLWSNNSCSSCLKIIFFSFLFLKKRIPCCLGGKAAWSILFLSDLRKEEGSVLGWEPTKEGSAEEYNSNPDLILTCFEKSMLVLPPVNCDSAFTYI